MTTATATEVEQIVALLEKASKTASESATAFTDVVDICTNGSDEIPSLPEARALLGQAYLARRWAEWAVEECDKALKELGDQVCFAEDRELNFKSDSTLVDS